jgi:hypothetical protein
LGVSDDPSNGVQGAEAVQVAGSPCYSSGSDDSGEASSSDQNAVEGGDDDAEDSGEDEGSGGDGGGPGGDGPGAGRGPLIQEL